MASFCVSIIMIKLHFSCKSYNKFIYNKEMKILKDRVTRIRDKRVKLNERSKGKNQDTNDNYYNGTVEYI